MENGNVKRQKMYKETTVSDCLILSNINLNEVYSYANEWLKFSSIRVIIIFPIFVYINKNEWI